MGLGKMNTTWISLAHSLILCCLLLLIGGCQNPEEEANTENQPPVPQTEEETPTEPGAEEPETAETPTTPDPKPEPVKQEPLTIPEVKLSGTHASSCKVKVGDTFPTATLPNLEGEETEWGSVTGEKLTVVLFWTDAGLTGMYSQEAIQDLQNKVAGSFQDLGVSVVGIYVGGKAEDAKSFLEGTETSFPMLVDAEEKLYSEVATDYLPRIYVLDSEGKIVWFDLEYTLSTQRNLMQTLKVSLQEEAAPNAS
ncbi:Hypothetical protein PBC10988_31590 [Planctomycetales bacterium 10988]|nr:Hypothetical protein PBC10988_31590 [Planctomycetales bacterium 10988]